MAEDPQRPDFTAELPDEPLPQPEEPTPEPKQGSVNGSSVAEALKNKAKDKGREIAGQRFQGLKNKLPFLRSSAARSEHNQPSSEERATKSQNVVEDVKTRARKQLVKRASQNAKIIAKRLVMQAVRYAVTTLGPYILPIIGVLILIVGIIFLLYYLLAGPKIEVTTEADKAAVTSLLAATGSPTATSETLIKTLDNEAQRRARVQALADKEWGVGSAQANRVKDEHKKIALLEGQLKAETGKKQRAIIVKQILQARLALDNTLPFGKWIAARAREIVANPVVAKEYTENACSITGASKGLGCGSVVSRILNEVGVPQQVVGSTLEVWDNRWFATVVDRQANNQLDPAYYPANKSKLQPGDIVWWGNGQGANKRYAGQLFDHVGIYVGNDQDVENSSNAKAVRLRKMTLNGTRVFNGAKRYGASN